MGVRVHVYVMCARVHACVCSYIHVGSGVCINYVHVQCCALRDWNVHFFSLL